MRIQVDQKVEIIRLTEQAPGLYTEAKDSAGNKLGAVNESGDFAPEIEAKPGDLLLVRVLE